MIKMENEIDIIAVLVEEMWCSIGGVSWKNYGGISATNCGNDGGCGISVVIYGGGGILGYKYGDGGDGVSVAKCGCFGGGASEPNRGGG